MIGNEPEETDTSLPNKTVGARQAEARSDPHRSRVQSPGLQRDSERSKGVDTATDSSLLASDLVNIKSHQGLVSRSFSKQALRSQLLFLTYLEVLPSPRTFLIPGLNPPT